MKIEDYVREFEEKINTAMQERYSLFPAEAKEHIIANSLVMNQLNIKNFLDRYKNSSYFDESRVDRLVDYFLDIKMQVFFIQEFQLGLYNSIIYESGEAPNYQESPYMLLKHLGLDQGTIVMSRILWERIMNFIYYLEKGIELKGTGKRKSKKTTFKKFVREADKWSFFEEYFAVIDGYDNVLRTPETHKNSRLRKLFMENKTTDAAMVLTIINIVSNIWQNIFAILDGGQAKTSHWNSGMGKFGVDAPEFPKI